MSDHDFRVLTIDTSARDAKLALVTCLPRLSVERADILDHLVKSEKCDESVELDSNSGGIGSVLSGMFKACSYSQLHGQQAGLPSSASKSLIPEIGNLLIDNDLSAADIGLLVVALGPGSFTGLRIGVVAAKTFAYSAHCNVVGIDLMDAIAHQTDWQNRQTEPSCFAVAVNAGRGDVLATRYERESGGLRRAGDAEIFKPDEWLQTLPDNAIVTGSGVDIMDPAAIQRSRCQFAAPEFRAACIETSTLLGIRKFLEAGTDDHWTMQPIYSRLSAAEEAAAARR